MRDHGGNLEAALARFGGRADAWIDLSTGINRRPYPLPEPSLSALHELPGAAAVAAAAAAARRAYGAPEAAACLPVAGAQAAIGLVPRLVPPGRVGVLSPTYNEHAAAFAAAGWRVEPVAEIGALTGFDAAVIVNPNNPDGRRWAPSEVLALVTRNGLVVVDESFADVVPEVSVASAAGRPGLVVLRSFGKFFGLAGLRLGFVLGDGAAIARLAALAGPWAVSGPALEAAVVALPDEVWARATRSRLAAEAARLDGFAAAAGWPLVGGTPLFRLYETGDAEAAQARLARARIWSRCFPYAAGWLRLGLPGSEAEWAWLAATLRP